MKTQTITTIEIEWEHRLSIACANQTKTDQISILNWLLGADRDRWDRFDDKQLAIVCAGLDYRFGILDRRYLDVSPPLAYKNLMERLGSFPAIRKAIVNHVRVQIDIDRQIVGTLETAIQDLLQHDRYLHQQIVWIRQCTAVPSLRDALLLANIEAYSLRNINDRPLLSAKICEHQHLATNP
jgi:hypothetical protein